MIDIIKPAIVSPDRFYTVMASINADAIRIIEKRPDDYYALWDENESPEPTEQEIIDADFVVYKAHAETVADAEAERRIALAEANPAVGQNLDENGRIRNSRRRNNKAKRKVNEITDADDHLLDHIDLIYDSLDLRLDAIENAADFAAVEAIINDISNDIHWPTWSPI